MFNVAPGKDANSPNQLKGSNPTVEENETAKLLELPGVLPQKSFVDSDNPEAITISITGNDIGFGQVLEKCVHPFKHLKDVVESESTCYDNYEDRAELVNTINAQFAKLRSLYESLRQNGMEGRRVYAVGYPQVAKVGGDCGLNVQMNADEVKFAHDLIEYLDSVIKRAADEAGVQYVDTQSAFDGHRLCEGLPGQMAVNGFTITKTADGGRNFKASFHPNQLGHQLLAQTIAGQTSNLSKPMPAAQPRTNEIILDNNIPLLQNVPKSNRPLRYVRVVHDLDGNVMSRMSPYKMVIESSDFFTKPNTVYNMVINSTPRNMGNFTSDANGNLSAETAIPADLPLGFHTVHLYGNDIFGNAIDIQKTIFVTAGTDDSDTDGIVDASDSCVYAAQSGIDADKDGVDDVCDPQIDAPPPTGGGTEPEGIVWSDKAIAPMEIQATAGP